MRWQTDTCKTHVGLPDILNVSSTLIHCIVHKCRNDEVKVCCLKLWSKFAVLKNNKCLIKCNVTLHVHYMTSCIQISTLYGIRNN